MSSDDDFGPGDALKVLEAAEKFRKKTPIQRASIAANLAGQYMKAIQKNGPLPLDLADKAATYFGHGVDWAIQEMEKEYGINQ